MSFFDHSEVQPGESPTLLSTSVDGAAMGVVCRNVTKEFGDGDTRNRVLQGISIEVPTAELTLLVGPSGCGKTTLISIIAGLLDATEGDVELFGQRQSQLSRAARVQFRAQNVGFVFQQYNLLPSLTAAENVAIPLLIARWNRNVAVERARDLLRQMGIADRMEAIPAHLSGGQQQRVAIARALIHEPRLLVCDEPTAALDGHSGQLVMELLRQVAVMPGRSVIVVTHDSRVYSYGDRRIEMADGRIVKITLNNAGNRQQTDESENGVPQ